MKTVTLAAYADMHGASKQAATGWRKKGALVMAGSLVDVEASDRRMSGAGLGRFKDAARTLRPTIAPAAPEHPRPAPQPDSSGKRPWLGWHPPGNRHTASANLREAVDSDDRLAIVEELDNVIFAEWDEACRAAGWAKWPGAVAGKIASELGLSARADQIEKVLSRHVMRRLLGDLGYDHTDLADPALQPR